MSRGYCKKFRKKTGLPQRGQAPGNLEQDKVESGSPVDLKNWFHSAMLCIAKMLRAGLSVLLRSS